ncbi:hypothetical protein EB796_006730 [Bugula neritina]|uniref:B box-type domain-containing protein n=1 Tax=Bugula neritina TaxID=10212 RepID=A0A7J7KBM5_BUGNE|nr:hypothetical protein EB796_006730 [Bugula neritina]
MSKLSSQHNIIMHILYSQPYTIIILCNNEIIVECPSLHDQTDTACDVCVRKDIHDQLATTYCTSCSTKFCLKHLQSHDDCFWDHVKIDMEEYKQQAKKLEPRPCSEHPDLEYSMGCGVCQVVICNKCVSNLGLCTDGAPHRLRSLEDLVPELYQEISELKTLIVNKEDVLSTVFKETAKTISDFEMETKMMVELLRKTCNNQINSIRQKYDNLEKDLMKFRNKIQKEMEHFMKNNVDRKLGILSDCKRKVEFDFQNSHKVDIVHGYSQAFKDMNDLLKGDPPALPSYNVVVLVKKGKIK